MKIKCKQRFYIEYKNKQNHATPCLTLGYESNLYTQTTSELKSTMLL